MRGGRRVLTLQSNWLNPLPVLLPFLVPVGVVALVDGFFWLAVIWRRLFCTFSSSEMNVFFNSFSYSSSSRRANSAINVSEWCWTRHSSSESSSFSWPTLHVSNSIIKGGYYIPHIKEIILYILTLLMDGARQSVGHGTLGCVGALMHVLAHIRRWRILQHPEPDEYIFPALNNRRVEKNPPALDRQFPWWLPRPTEVARFPSRAGSVPRSTRASPDRMPRLRPRQTTYPLLDWASIIVKKRK